MKTQLWMMFVLFAAVPAEASQSVSVQGPGPFLGAARARFAAEAPAALPEKPLFKPAPVRDFFDDLRAAGIVARSA